MPDESMTSPTKLNVTGVVGVPVIAPVDEVNVSGESVGVLE